MSSIPPLSRTRRSTPPWFAQYLRDQPVDIAIAPPSRREPAFPTDRQIDKQKRGRIGSYWESSFRESAGCQKKKAETCGPEP